MFVSTEWMTDVAHILSHQSQDNVHDGERPVKQVFGSVSMIMCKTKFGSFGSVNFKKQEDVCVSSVSDHERHDRCA
jgi:hypothetical protein